MKIKRFILMAILVVGAIVAVLPRDASAVCNTTNGLPEPFPGTTTVCVNLEDPNPSTPGRAVSARFECCNGSYVNEPATGAEVNPDEFDANIRGNPSIDLRIPNVCVGSTCTPESVSIIDREIGLFESDSAVTTYIEGQATPNDLPPVCASTTGTCGQEEPQQGCSGEPVFSVLIVTAYC